MKTIGLCMIVKNEARVIVRCLESVRPLVDYVLVEDTGSTDGTQQIIRDWLARENLAGAVFDEPWRDFAHNRSLALARLREHAEIDYALIMDADDVLVLDPGFDPAAFKASLDADLYHVMIHLGPVRYHRPHICSNRLEYRYRGVVHEFLEGPEGNSSGTAVGFRIDAGVEGARSEDPEKYRKDAQILAQALEGEDDPLLRSRYTFYMAQSWRDCGENEKALAGYLERPGMGFWDEEIFISLYNAAQLKEKLDHPGYEIIGMYLRAYEACPRRAESLHAAARYCRNTGKNHQGYMLAKQGLDIPQPGGGLFIEPWIYEYGLLDEVGVNGYWADRHQESLDACERLLSEGKMPEDMRERIEANARFARGRLQEAVSGGARERPELAEQEGDVDGRPIADKAPSTSPLFKTTSFRDEDKCRIIIHAGLHKTGTTALQIFLSTWAEDLKAEKILYPSVGRVSETPFGHHNIAWQLADDKRFDPTAGTVDDIAAEIASFDGDAVISSEDFEGILRTPDRFEPLFQHDLLKNHHFTILIYVRDQASYLESLFFENLRNGSIQGASEICNSAIEDGMVRYLNWTFQFDYATICDCLRQARGKFIIRPYAQPPENSSIVDFLAFLGVEWLGDASELWRQANWREDLTGSFIQFAERQCETNILEIPQFAEWSSSLVQKRSVHFSDAARAALRARFAEGNFKVATEHAFPTDTLVISDALPDHFPIECLFARDTLRALVRSYAASDVSIDVLATRQSALSIKSTEAIEGKMDFSSVGRAFHICHVSINEHDRLFDQIICMLKNSLSELGFHCSVSKNNIEKESINIVLGSVVFAAKYGLLSYLNTVPYVLYQLEQLVDGAGHLKDIPEYLSIVHAAKHTFDYSLSNLRYLEDTHKGVNFTYLPFSFHPCLEVFTPACDPDIDVLFVGSHTARRALVIDALRNFGCVVMHAFNVYEDELVGCMRRAKIVLNIHAFEAIDILETPRLSFALANHCFVISEIGDHNPYGSGVVYASYDNLISTCLLFLGPKASDRAAIAMEGYTQYTLSSFTKDLAEAIMDLSLDELIATNSENNISETQEHREPHRSVITQFLKVDDRSDLSHSGIDYLEFLRICAKELHPKSYLEIGTEAGHSLKQFNCDALCIDPSFQIADNVLVDRRKTFFFQMSSDSFFKEHNPRLFFSDGIDVSFLDGLHHFEALLRDFIHCERASHHRSVIFLHDCLPTDAVMTSRTFRWGGWTGDVWKLLYVFQKYRHDLSVVLLDCPPTGLVACYGLNCESTTLDENYETLLAEFGAIDLDEERLRDLRSLFPLIDTRKLVEVSNGVEALFTQGFRWTKN